MSYIITVKALVIEDEKVLICFKKNGEIVLPGGTLEEDNIIDCLKRELKEELNLDDYDYEILFPVTSKVYDTKYGKKVGIYYLVKIKNKEKINPQNEIKDVKWIEINSEKIPRWLKEIINDYLRLKRIHSFK